ncbi:4Fe-4S dicluster domain-containing protein [bacterium]|nr:4Fe-4S dicluster domain-containing protein [bacterium]
MKVDSLITNSRRIHVDAKLCRDCQTCVLACSLHHEGKCGLSLARLAILKDMEKYEFEILICKHCESPKCVLACPADAIRIDDRGIALIVDEDCERCGICAESCPYDAIFYNEEQDRYLKCDLCADRDGKPLCVELCPVGALTAADNETEV